MSTGSCLVSAAVRSATVTMSVKSPDLEGISALAATAMTGLGAARRATTAGPAEVDGAGDVHPTDSVERVGLRCDRLATAVVEGVAQRGEQTGASVGAGAAAEREDNAAHTQAHGVPDRFAKSVARGGHRGQYIARQRG